MKTRFHATTHARTPRHAARLALAPLALAFAAGSATAQPCFSWNQMSSVGAPSPRYSAAAGFDSDRGVLIIHGGSGSPGIQFETWEFDGSFWTRRQDGSPVTGGNAMEYDTRRGKMVFAANDSHLYEFDVPSGSWIDAVTVPGQSSAGTRMAFDEARGVMVIVLPSGVVYTWDGVSLTPVATGPSGRLAFGMAYDSDRQRVVLCGGSLGVNMDNTDTWEWDGTTWTMKTNVAPSLVQQPQHTVYDRSRHRVVAMGASSNATYDWDGSVWTQIDNTGPTPVHAAFSMAYDRAHARTLLFGGNSSTDVLNDLWSATSSGPVFTLQPTNFTAIQGSGASFTALCTSQVQAYQWRKNGTLIAGATSPVLHIPAVSNADAGAYDVIATGLCGSTAVSTPATLNVSCYANCDGSTSSPTLNVADFTCFLQRYAAGCP